jgi:hypothetical protein
MEQVIIVDGNGEFFGECPKCKKWRKLEFAHHDYGSDNHSRSTGMYLCHVCNVNEKSVNPEKTTEERERVAIRDYYRTNRITISKNYGNGKRVMIQYNRKTGNIQISEQIRRLIWSGNIGTDYPEIVYVQDGEMEE